MKKDHKKSIWVFGDYRNYYQNRVTLQLISKAMDLAKTINAEGLWNIRLTEPIEFWRLTIRL
jgi:hypothetical protein